MFRFAAHNKVFWPVELATRGEDGEPVTAIAYIGYLLLTREELIERDDAALRVLTARDTPMPARLDATRALEKANADLLRARIFNWRDIVDNDDKPLSFSADTLAAMLADPLLFNALLRGLFEASRGAKEKNLSPGPGGAPAPAQHTASTGSGTANNATAASPPVIAGTSAGA